jgi:hypothetical protein
MELINGCIEKEKRHKIEGNETPIPYGVRLVGMYTELALN